MTKKSKLKVKQTKEPTSKLEGFQVSHQKLTEAERQASCQELLTIIRR